MACFCDLLSGDLCWFYSYTLFGVFFFDFLSGDLCWFCGLSFVDTYTLFGVFFYCVVVDLSHRSDLVLPVSLDGNDE